MKGKNIAIYGSTCSIGTSTLNVISGLKPTYNMIKNGKTVALAYKAIQSKRENKI